MSEDRNPADLADEPLDPQAEEFDELEEQGQEGEDTAADADTSGEDRHPGAADDRERTGGPDADAADQSGAQAPGRPPRQSANVRRNQSIRAFREARQAAERRTAALEQQIAFLTGAGAAQNQAQLAALQEQERQRLEMMSPEDRANYRMALSEQRVGQALLQTRLAMAEQADAMAFRARTERDPEARRLAAAVEDLHRQAPTITREQLLAYEIGRRELERRDAARGRAAARVTLNNSGQRVRPPASGRADVAAERRGGDGGRAARARRLDGVLI